MARAGALEGAALPSQTVHHIRWLGLRHAVTRGGLCPNSTALRSLRRFESFCLRSRVSPAKAAPTERVGSIHRIADRDCLKTVHESKLKG